MLRRIKNMLGIESVKLTLEVPDSLHVDAKEITGLIHMTTQNDAVVESISIRLIEKYTRGRKESKLIDEYVISKILVEERVELLKDEKVSLPFQLPFQLIQSPMDQLQSKNFFSKMIVGLAKKLKGVKSEYRILAELKIKGTVLQPFAETSIQITS